MMVGLVFALAVAVFAIQNSAPVTVAFLRWRFDGLSLALVILGSSAAGAVVVGLIGAVREVRLALALRSWRGRAERLSAELDAERSKAVSSEREVERLRGELHEASRRLEEAGRRQAELEAELEATQSMEILPRPQEGAEADAHASEPADASGRGDSQAGSETT